MEQTPAKPVNRRRRWLIAAVVLLLAWLVLWWYWPRGDARFVGKWGHVEGEGEPPIGFVDLSSNGMGVMRRLDGARSLPFGWRVEGDRLIFGSKYVQKWPRIRSMLKGFGYLIIPEESYRIVETGENRINLHSGTFEMTLRRVPE